MHTVITYKMLFSGLGTTPFKMLLTTIISGSLPATVSDFVTSSVMQVSFVFDLTFLTSVVRFRCSHGTKTKAIQDLLESLRTQVNSRRNKN